MKASRLKRHKTKTYPSLQVQKISTIYRHESFKIQLSNPKIATRLSCNSRFLRNTETVIRGGFLASRHPWFQVQRQGLFRLLCTLRLVENWKKRIILLLRFFLLSNVITHYGYFSLHFHCVTIDCLYLPLNANFFCNAPFKTLQIVTFMNK